VFLFDVIPQRWYVLKGGVLHVLTMYEAMYCI